MTYTPTDEQIEALADFMAEQRDRYPRVVDDMDSAELVELMLEAPAFQAIIRAAQADARQALEKANAERDAAWEIIGEKVNSENSLANERDYALAALACMSDSAAAAPMLAAAGWPTRSRQAIEIIRSVASDPQALP